MSDPYGIRTQKGPISHSKEPYVLQKSPISHSKEPYSTLYSGLDCAISLLEHALFSHTDLTFRRENKIALLRNTTVVPPHRWRGVLEID